jgi:3-deoxy-D-manno-octulosonate 8-phosphate phosphatase (KDO 8-P phosphatase)
MVFKVFILDVDSVMTNGQSLYSEAGKQMKIFGPDDNDGLRLLNPNLKIRFVTGDRKGLPITIKRIKEDMKFDLDLVSTIKRIEWIKEHYNPKEVIYMGDGIFDHYVMKEVGYSIEPANSDKIAKAHVNYVTQRSGGDRAVAEACLHIMQKFFTAYEPDQLPSDQLDFGGWKI